MPVRDTIAAIATPPGRGGIGVVRISGPDVGLIARRVLGELPAPRQARYSRFLGQDGQPLDCGIAIYFPGPASYTGEDTLEVQGHGGPVVMDMLLKRCIQCGARQARPGEFTERAFHNGKLDLAQAEAVADLIDSASEAAARSAHRSLQGAFSTAVTALVEEVISLRSYVEAAIDFPEEEIDFLDDDKIVQAVDGIIASTKTLLRSARQGSLLREGFTVVLAGPPNAGKSSLLNALARYDRAIVSETPGTTRDTIEVHVELDGLPLRLIDTAGLREGGDDLETEGIRRTRAELDKADHVLLVTDDSVNGNPEETARPVEATSYTRVLNKIDLSRRDKGPVTAEAGHSAVAVSAKTGNGLVELRQHLKQVAGYQPAEGATFTARTRHLHALRQALVHFEAGRERLLEDRAGELLAEELRLAQGRLSEITGEFTSDDLLGRIFASFCIGK